MKAVLIRAILAQLGASLCRIAAMTAQAEPLGSSLVQLVGISLGGAPPQPAESHPDSTPGAKPAELEYEDFTKDE